MQGSAWTARLERARYAKAHVFCIKPRIKYRGLHFLGSRRKNAGGLHGAGDASSGESCGNVGAAARNRVVCMVSPYKPLRSLQRNRLSYRLPDFLRRFPHRTQGFAWMARLTRAGHANPHLLRAISCTNRRALHGREHRRARRCRSPPFMRQTLHQTKGFASLPLPHRPPRVPDVVSAALVRVEQNRCCISDEQQPIPARGPCKPPPLLHQTPHQTKGFASPLPPHRPPRAPDAASAALARVEQNRCCISDEQQPIPTRERRNCSARLSRAKPLLHFRRLVRALLAMHPFVAFCVLINPPHHVFGGKCMFCRNNPLRSRLAGRAGCRPHAAGRPRRGRARLRRRRAVARSRRFPFCAPPCARQHGRAACNYGSSEFSPRFGESSVQT